MTFHFSRQGLTGAERRLQRALEILPALTSWTILIGMVWLAFWRPLIAAVFIIAFDLYWLFRLFYMTLFLVLSYLRLSIEDETDWLSRAKALARGGAGVAAKGWRTALSAWFHRREVETWSRSRADTLSVDDILHLVIIPVAREGRAVVEPGVAALASQTFPSGRILLLIALEERAPEAVRLEIHQLAEFYRQRFYDLRVVVHPSGVPGEARVKGANTSHAGREAARLLAQKGIPFENVIASCFDADTVVSRQYMACLAYHFLVYPQRTQASFQPIPVYHNNIWDAPGFARVLDIGSSFFQLVEATNPETLVTFSSHSMSFKALVDVGYWPVDMISDDSAIYWKAYIHYDGRYRVVPMYVTVSMDVVAARSWWRTIQHVYKQKRRWAWGVENFPIVVRGFRKAQGIPLYDRVRLTVKLLGGHVSWATWAFLLTFIGWLPALFAGREFSNTVLYYSAPRITGIIFNLASLALITTVVLSLCLLPKEKMHRPWLQRIGLALEWLSVPLIAVFLSAIPALDAQTRLMLGKYMEFWVTEKRRE